MSSTTTSRKKCRQPRPRISTRSRKVKSTGNSWWDRCANRERGTYAEEEALCQRAHLVSCTPPRRAGGVYGRAPPGGIDAADPARSAGTRDPCPVGSADLCRALILDSRVVDLRMVYTDAVPFHDL